MDPMYYETNDNQVFNHNFVFANKKGDFPAGWQKSRERRTACFWEGDDKQNFWIRIKNRASKLSAGICQERPYFIAVYTEQVWEVGAVIKVIHELSATIKVHFLSHSSSRVQSTSLNFSLDPERDYYYGIVTVPPGADQAMIEIGTSEAGTLYVEDVVFKRVFPTERYDADARGRLNINNVDSVNRILEPVSINGSLELVRPTKDIVEDVTADNTVRYSTILDVFQLTSYSYCVINHGPVDAFVGIQLSPNGNNWVEDSIADNHIDPGQMNILVNNRFARYVRLRYRANIGNTRLCIYFQGQG